MRSVTQKGTLKNWAIYYILEVGDGQSRHNQKFEGNNSENFVHGDEIKEIDVVVYETEGG